MELGPVYQGFWQDFTIADAFGVDAIKDTYNRAFQEWKDNYEFLTDLVMVLNHKIWHYYGTKETYAAVYNDLWAEADEYAVDTLKGEELMYFLRMTD